MNICTQNHIGAIVGMIESNSKNFALSKKSHIDSRVTDLDIWLLKFGKNEKVRIIRRKNKNHIRLSSQYTTKHERCMLLTELLWDPLFSSQNTKPTCILLVSSLSTQKCLIHYKKTKIGKHRKRSVAKWHRK